MDYKSALGRLLRLVDHERIVSSNRERVRYDLSRMEALLDRLGNPQLSMPAVHIAGTKGKGSTAAICSSVLTHAGYRTGLYTSPHLHTFRERIRLDGAPVTESEFADLVEDIWPALEWVSTSGGNGEVTMFEALTAMAFCHFRDSADIQVLEVGLGGRLDTTNLVRPPGLKACAITSLSLDHTSILGDNIESIAREKAGIVKRGVPVVTSPQPPEAMAVIRSACLEKDAELIVGGEDLKWHGGARGPEGQALHVRGRLGEYWLWTPLLGDWQLENATTAIGVLELLKDNGFEISDHALEQGLRGVAWPCRMEVVQLSPLVVCDGAHNPYSVARLRDSLPDYFGHLRMVPIVGVSQDKDLAGIAKELAGLASRFIVTRSRHPRAAPTSTLADALRVYGVETEAVENVDGAVRIALEYAGEDGLVLATGSLFVAAEVREAIMGIEPELYPELSSESQPSQDAERIVT